MTPETDLEHIHVGSLVREVRTQLGITQADAGEQMGTGKPGSYQQHFRNQEMKRDMYLTDMIRIERALGLSPGWFLRRVGYLTDDSAPSIADRLLEDPALDDAGRALVIGVYRLAVEDAQSHPHQSS